MIDSIAEIIAKARCETAIIDMIDVQAAKQIRQQIGRELLEYSKTFESSGINNVWAIKYVATYKIREVCKLEEEGL